MLLDINSLRYDYYNTIVNLIGKLCEGAKLGYKNNICYYYYVNNKYTYTIFLTQKNSFAFSEQYVIEPILNQLDLNSDELIMLFKNKEIHQLILQCLTLIPSKTNMIHI